MKQVFVNLDGKNVYEEIEYTDPIKAVNEFEGYAGVLVDTTKKYKKHPIKLDVKVF